MRSLNVLNFFVSQLLEIGQAMNMSWERLLPLIIYMNFKNLELKCDFYVQCCDVQYQTYEKITQYHTYARLRNLKKIDLYTLISWNEYVQWYYEM